MRHILTAAALLSCAAFGQAQYGPPLSLGTQVINDLELHDADGDGLLDVVGIQGGFFNSGRVTWNRNLGGGQLGPLTTLVAPLDLTGNIVFGDFDGDGDDDLFVAEFSFDRIRYYEALGGASFSAGTVIGSGINGVLDLAVADLDNDGDLDLAAVAFVGDALYWVENLGGGSAAPAQLLSAGLEEATSVVAGDLDGDGWLDLVSTSGLDDKVAWYPNLGGGLFGAQQVLTTASDYPNQVRLGDLDGDADLDLAVAFLNGNAFGWIENLGGGAFGTLQIIEAGVSSAASLALEDLDLDGDLDVLGGSTGVGGIRWYENDSSGSFAAAQPLPVTTSGFVSGVGAADMDGDSDLDVVTTRAAWFQNVATLESGFCTSLANSLGVTAELTLTGSSVAELSTLSMTATGLPPSATTLFLISDAPGFSAHPGGSDGNLCLGGVIGRYNRPGELQVASPAGDARLSPNLADTPTPTGTTQVLMGETRHFQAWYRDGAVASNFTDGVLLLFR